MYNPRIFDIGLHLHKTCQDFIHYLKNLQISSMCLLFCAQSKRSKLYYNKDTFLFIEGVTGKNEIGVYLSVRGNLGIDRFKWQEI